ncbi:MAG: 2-dehydropantoate 2-reductase [Alphaproteobacteria bacterium]|jgi:2-dehydropantoate 2-reductase|nr:2-dehydropantoate 2-reductase [Alphaproteobacteria bacterium]
MKIAIMAAGGVGGYFGARLAAAGEEVHFIARGAHLDAIRRDGLKLESALGDIHLNDAPASDDPATIGAVDMVLFAVKLGDSEAAALACKPLLGDRTTLIMLQNGVGGVARLSAILDRQAVVGGVAYISSFIAQPGTIRHHGDFARLQFGEGDGSKSARLGDFARVCAKAGIDAELAPDIELAQWQKFTLLVGMSGATAMTRQPIGAVLGDPTERQFFLNLMAETVAVGRARGIALDADYARDRLAFAEQSLPPAMRASMLDDLERGKPLELDWLAGEVARLGRQLAIPTPANDEVYATLKPHRGGAN